MTAPQLSVDTVSTSAPNTILLDNSKNSNSFDKNNSEVEKMLPQESDREYMEYDKLFSLKPDTDIENDNIANGNKILNKMIEQAKTIENPENLIYKNAMYRSDIGSIDFVWGKAGTGAKFKKGYGLAHIIAKHS